jgi:hypothetical protein
MDQDELGLQEHRDLERGIASTAKRVRARSAYVDFAELCQVGWEASLSALGPSFNPKRKSAASYTSQRRYGAMVEFVAGQSAPVSVHARQNPRLRTERAIAAGPPVSLDAPSGAERIPDDGTPETIALNREQTIRIEAWRLQASTAIDEALASLRPAERRAVQRLWRVAGKPPAYAEVARSIGVAPTAINGLRRKLREMFRRSPALRQLWDLLRDITEE